MSKPLRIVYGNALNAACAFLAHRQEAKSGDVLKVAEVFAKWLIEHGGTDEDQHPAAPVSQRPTEAVPPSGSGVDPDLATCPDCGGDIYDNRLDKRRGRAPAGGPDYKCMDVDDCGWAYWIDPPKGRKKKAAS